MNIEESNLENEVDLDGLGEQIEPIQEKKPKKRKYVFIGIGLLVLSCICLLATGILKINTDFYAGGFSVTNIVVTDKFGSDGRPISGESKTTFDPTGRINTAVYTSGIDATVGMIWYHENELLYELFERTRDNYIATYIEGAPHQPLPGGNYRVEIHIGRNGSPEKTVRFTVEEVNLNIVPSNPTPEGHVDIENAPFLEVPFIFDEVWQIEGEEWQINEAKIVFLEDTEIFVVIVETDLSPLDLSEEEVRSITRPVAQFSIENGFWEQARQIQINGETYNLDEPLAITLINPEKPGQGKRTRFDIDELLESE